jgi:hypothetical protein
VLNLRADIRNSASNKKSRLNKRVDLRVKLNCYNFTKKEGARSITMFRSIFLSSTVAFCAVLTGCATSSGDKSDLKKIYDQTAQYHLPDRNPIIVIPGILGSRLVDQPTGLTVWGAFRSNYADPKTAAGARLISLPLDGSIENSGQSSTSVKPDGVLANLELKLAGFPLSIQAYAGILTTLGAGGYRDESLGLNSIDYGTDHFTCFQFDYDWRLDLVENSGKLKTFIEEKRADVQRNYEEKYGIKDADVQFDIVAHSMGSLLSRYYLRYGEADLPNDGTIPEVTWAGAEDLDRVILVAPPNAGSLEAFGQLIDGFDVGRPLLPYYEPALLGTFPSVYELMPRSRHGAVVWDDDVSRPVKDLFDPELWDKYDWGLSAQDEETNEFLQKVLPNIDSQQERHEVAVAFQKWALARANQFHQALDQPAEPPTGADIFLVAGDSEKTPELVSVDSESGEISILKYGVGDGKVLRSSALLDERVGGTWTPTVQTPIDWSSVMFLFSGHRQITSEPVFEDNVLYWLLEDPRGR